jgi:hypothetical protein
LAKKRRQKIEKKDDYVFKPPEFDKNDFIRNEMQKAKTTFIAFFFAVIMAFVSFGFLILLNDYRAGAVIGILAAFAMIFIFNILKIDFMELEMLSRLSAFGVYYFTWLVILIILSNPPITDLAEPEIHNVKIEINNVNIIANSTISIWDPAENLDAEGFVIINVNRTFRIRAEIWDNFNLDTNSIRCELHAPDDIVITLTRKEHFDQIFSFEHIFSGTNVQTGLYEYQIHAKDVSGNTALIKGSIHVQ